MDEAVLVDPDVDEGAEGGDVRHDAGKGHPRPEVLDIRDAGGEAVDLKLPAGVSSGLCQLCEDVPDGGKARRPGDVPRRIDPFLEGGVFDQLLDGNAQVFRYRLNDPVAFGVDGGSVEGAIPAPDPQEARRLLEGPGAEAGDLF